MKKATKATTAPVLAMTNEMAIKLARGFKTGIKNKTQVTAILTAALDAWINRKEIAARDFILAFWDALNGDKAAVAVVRALMNRLCKRINKENGKPNAPALTVKNGELVDVVPRGGNGGGEGEGDGSIFTAKETPKSIELRGNIAILRAHLETVNDVAIRAALKQAIAVYAAQL
tara:strand:+ start:679 stop:1200 length:522 start_codon:yes stop_codon:yes gene_type:complete